ncbi:hypothetical protein SBA4_5760003 [Candidatus Sulfopaludibacter sp. SbA4]|nr:hypothetical protein SBA4_5760003 [Candidatus Sulfopaludibacter sp. SbA4]
MGTTVALRQRRRGRHRTRQPGGDGAFLYKASAIQRCLLIDAIAHENSSGAIAVNYGPSYPIVAGFVSVRVLVWNARR